MQNPYVPYPVKIAEVVTETEDKSLKAQMRRAHKLGSARVLILGGRELESGRAVLKNMADGGQQEIGLDEITAVFHKSGE